MTPPPEMIDNANENTLTRLCKKLEVSEPSHQKSYQEDDRKQAQQPGHTTLPTYVCAFPLHPDSDSCAKPIYRDNEEEVWNNVIINVESDRRT